MNNTGCSIAIFLTVRAHRQRKLNSTNGPTKPNKQRKRHNNHSSHNRPVRKTTNKQRLRLKGGPPTRSDILSKQTRALPQQFNSPSQNLQGLLMRQKVLICNLSCGCALKFLLHHHNSQPIQLRQDSSRFTPQFLR